MSIQCILFDLDGTLLDTSYDFAYALNKTCQEFSQPPLRYQDIRKVVSQGGLAMTQLAFPDLSGDELQARRTHFLKIYFDNIARHTQLFPSLEAGLQALANNAIPWGIVTNKPGWLTAELLTHFNFPSTPHSIVSGDTLAVRKPHPEPLWLAAQQCQVEPQHCLYIGDHPRDIKAGVNAGMRTAAALFGYIPEDSTAQDWQADYHFGTPYELTEFLTTLTTSPHSNLKEML
ncbi:HAD family hydrolase [Thiomicrorhabdus aquaedulcis]|uniref:HAD family hydrolase n=1 Tax=Thiomicrorhabdus aquaedulcis TaxID=2211106 RepID=UPI000FDC8C24|nr:HAD-IA family hydrolase [Thiomicrorhabdus aquaedulcis]